MPNHTAQARLKHLQKSGERVYQEFADANIGKELRVLVEKVNGGKFSGWSENYLSCDETNFLPFPDQEIVKGKVVRGVYQSIEKSSKNNEE